MMNQELSSFTAKLDALREKGFSDDEINTILSSPAPQAQPSAQADMSNPESVGVYQFLKSSPSSMPVTDDMTESDRAYAKEWNKRIDKLSFFFGWKADLIWIIWFIVVFSPLVIMFFNGNNSLGYSIRYSIIWAAICFVTTFIFFSVIKEKIIIPNMKFFLLKR